MYVNRVSTVDMVDEHIVVACFASDNDRNIEYLGDPASRSVMARTFAVDGSKPAR